MDTTIRPNIKLCLSPCHICNFTIIVLCLHMRLPIVGFLVTRIMLSNFYDPIIITVQGHIKGAIQSFVV